MLTWLFISCQTSTEKESDTHSPNDTAQDAVYEDPDFNTDGKVDILILGSSLSVNGQAAFDPTPVASALQSIFEGDSSIDKAINIVAEDIYTAQDVTLGLGGNGAEQVYRHHRHSLLQYYYWPDNSESRMASLRGAANHDWDYVVIAADPYITSTLPGYYALGVNKIASVVQEGNAQPLLLMVWDQNPSTTMEHLEEFTYRVGDGLSEPASVVPAGLAWAALSTDMIDSASEHPTPHGAYLAAAAIYAHITQSNAAASDYNYDQNLADIAFDTVQQAQNQDHYSGAFVFSSPFQACSVSDDTLTYNHTGSSSENGILDGLRWVFDQAPESLESGGDTPITFNYGRANSNFEPNKRYQIDAERFSFSFGFPMQDHGNHGNTSMLYGLDKRDGGVMNDTDLGVARFMVEQSELPTARAIPIRTLFAQMKEHYPEQSAYRDAWHMHRDLDKSIAAYMYTLLTGTCALGNEPTDSTSAEWRTWNAHRIGCTTAWTLMSLESVSPF